MPFGTWKDKYNRVPRAFSCFGDSCSKVFIGWYWEERMHKGSRTEYSLSHFCVREEAALNRGGNWGHLCITSQPGPEAPEHPSARGTRPALWWVLTTDECRWNAQRAPPIWTCSLVPDTGHTPSTSGKLFPSLNELPSTPHHESFHGK